MSKLNTQNIVLGKFFQAVFIFIFISAVFGFSPKTTVEARGDSSAPAETEEAAPLFAATPFLDISPLGNVQIGADFSFTATFDNTSAVDTGYGPFIDLYFPVTGVDGAGAATDDGISFLGASFLGSPVNSSNIRQLTFDATGTVTHPFLRNVDGSYMTVSGTPGDMLVIIQLPFGSFTPTQPAAVVTVDAHLSDLADLSDPTSILGIRSRAGFRYGNDPLDNFCCGDPPLTTAGPSTATWPQDVLTPALISVTKTYSGL